MAKPVYTSKSAAALLHYGERIFLEMTENAELFPNPHPSLATLENRLDAYRQAFAEATFRDRRAVQLKRQRGAELQKTIYRLSQYVDAVALGDPATILAAGYRPSRPGSHIASRTPRAEHLRVEHVQVGTGLIRLRVKPWKLALVYRFEYRRKGTDNWEATLSSKSSLELGTLEMFEEYEFRASYIGRAVTLNFSDTVTAIIV